MFVCAISHPGASGLLVSVLAGISSERGFTAASLLESSAFRDFSGGPVGKTPCSQCRGPRFDPWSVELDPTFFN